MVSVDCVSWFVVNWNELIVVNCMPEWKWYLQLKLKKNRRTHYWSYLSDILECVNSLSIYCNYGDLLCTCDLFSVMSFISRSWQAMKAQLAPLVSVPLRCCWLQDLGTKQWSYGMCLRTKGPEKHWVCSLMVFLTYFEVKNNNPRYKRFWIIKWHRCVCNNVIYLPFSVWWLGWFIFDLFLFYWCVKLTWF